MLTRLRLRNFKCWNDTGDLRLRPITGLFGANGSGKTSLLQSLLLLMQTADSSDRGTVFSFGASGGLIDLGDFCSTAHNHAGAPEMEVSLDWCLDKPLRVIDPETRRNALSEKQLGFTVAADLQDTPPKSRPAVKVMSYRVGEAVFGMRRKKDSDYALFSKNTGFEFGRHRDQSRRRQLPAPKKFYGFPHQVRAHYRNAEFLADLELALETRLENIFYLGPLRVHPERNCTWARGCPLDTGSRGEATVAAILAARERGRYIPFGSGRRKRTLEAHVAHWLKKLQLAHDFRIDRISEESCIYQAKIRQTRGAPEVLIPDIGLGVAQILPILTLCFYVPKGSTIILEQPETRMHPSIQSGLADVLIDAWKTREVQILLESHSEHLLRRLQRRIAEETLSENEVGLFFCSARKQHSEVTALDLNTYGNIRNWPEDFFGDEFGEITAMAEAGLKRKIALKE